MLGIFVCICIAVDVVRVCVCVQTDPLNHIEYLVFCQLSKSLYELYF
jgi:hypothetical protein